jgi:hypothetical protein
MKIDTDPTAFMPRTITLETIGDYNAMREIVAEVREVPKDERKWMGEDAENLHVKLHEYFEERE